MTAAEMPWVTETRLAPGQRPKRNPVFGILAIVGAAIGCGLFVVAFLIILVALSTPGGGDLVVLFVWLLPIWGVVMLGTIGCSIAALARRGRANLSLGITALGLIVLANPFLPLILVLSVSQ